MELLIFLPPDHCLMGNAVAHQIKLIEFNARRRADLSRVLAILAFIEADVELRLSSTKISSRLWGKCVGA